MGWRSTREFYAFSSSSSTLVFITKQQEVVQIANLLDRLTCQVAEPRHQAVHVVHAEGSQSPDLVGQQLVQMAIRVAGVPLGVHDEAARARAESRVLYLQ